MKRPRRLLATTLMLLMLSSGAAFAQGRGQGQPQQDKKATNTSVQTTVSAKNVSVQFQYTSGDRDAIRTWYSTHENNLPPGLAKRDRLPPGLERQLRERGTLPPGLQKKITPVPVTLVRELPRPPVGCGHVVIGGNIVLIDIKTFYVHAVFRL